MKRFLILFSLILVLAFGANAEEGYGVCSIGADSYVEGTAYITLSGTNLKGNLVITNSSPRPLQSASIKVTVKYKWKTSHISPYDGGNVVNKFSDSKTLYDSRWTGNIAGYQSGNIDLSSDISVPSGAYDVEIESIDVSINNLYCN